jgi:ribosomal subunit interface protein
VDVVVKGRHLEVSDRFRQHTQEKLARLEKYDHRLMRVEVQVSEERNPRLSAQSHRVELTVRSKGPAVRAEAAAEDKMAALDLALERLEAQLRKAADRRRGHHGSRRPASLSDVLTPEPDGVPEPQTGHVAEADADQTEQLVVREKSHRAAPMSIDQALYEMELVGHDFYLFHDEKTHQPAVVYRRHGYHYGVIRLED